MPSKPYASTALLKDCGWQCAAYCVAIRGAARVTTLFHSSMQLIDIHTHSVKTDGNIHIADVGTDAIYNTLCSVGIHPWKISAGWREDFDRITGIAANGCVAAIGECGFDLLKSPATEEEQYRIFLLHAELSESLQKPLIIHLVKGQQLLLKAAKEFPHTQAWIIHGFRGKAQQAQQLLSAGTHISLGEHFNADTAATIPADRLFIESDESTMPLHDIYARIATARGCSVEELAKHITANALGCNLLKRGY